MDLSFVYDTVVKSFGESITYTDATDSSTYTLSVAVMEDYSQGPEHFENRQESLVLCATSSDVDDAGIALDIGDTITRSSVDYKILEHYTDDNGGVFITIARSL